MKKTLVMASLVAASTSMMAMDLQYFLGAGAERANANFKADVNAPSIGYSETFKEDGNDTAPSRSTYWIHWWYVGRTTWCWWRIYHGSAPCHDYGTRAADGSGNFSFSYCSYLDCCDLATSQKFAN